MLKDILFCHMDNCTFQVSVPINASMEQCDKAIEAYKEHLKTHSLGEVVEHLFDCIMCLREENDGNWRFEPKKELVTIKEG